eukprot:6197706-Pleurochrysis_carterae.AAC.1
MVWSQSSSLGILRLHRDTLSKTRQSMIDASMVGGRRGPSTLAALASAEHGAAWEMCTKVRRARGRYGKRPENSTEIPGNPEGLEKNAGRS